MYRPVDLNTWDIRNVTGYDGKHFLVLNDELDPVLCGGAEDAIQYVAGVYEAELLAAQCEIETLNSMLWKIASEYKCAERTCLKGIDDPVECRRCALVYLRIDVTKEVDEDE